MLTAGIRTDPENSDLQSSSGRTSPLGGYGDVKMNFFWSCVTGLPGSMRRLNLSTLCTSNPSGNCKQSTGHKYCQLI